MTSNASVATGPQMDPDQEAEHRRSLAEVYADEADEAVAAIEEKIAGMQETLKARKAEAKELRAQLRKLDKDGGE